MNIDYNEVLRYLKSQDMKNSNMETLILDVIDETKKIASPKYIYKIFHIEKQDNINIINTNVSINSKNLMKHLRNSKKVAIMGATLGVEVDRAIRINEKINLTKSIIMDAVATALIESVCDDVQNIIKKQAKDRGYNITSRFSPGYGDLNIETQREILQIIDGSKIGITLTDSYIMIPRKSVSAIIGFCDDDPKESIKCENCNKKEDCEFKK